MRKAPHILEMSKRFEIKSNLKNITKLFCLPVDFHLDLAYEDQTKDDPNKNGVL